MVFEVRLDDARTQDEGEKGEADEEEAVKETAREEEEVQKRGRDTGTPESAYIMPVRI